MSVVAAFDRADRYDEHAGIQRRVANALADRIAALPLPPTPRILEVGCGTGLLGAALVDRLSGADWLMTDIAPAMVGRTARRFASHPRVQVSVMDGERPSTQGPFDLICSSLAAQWFVDLPSAIARLRERLAPGGRLAFTTLLAGSFAEWQRAHGPLPSGLHAYPGPAALMALGLTVEVDQYLISHGDAAAFLRTLRAIGAGTPRRDYRPLSPPQLRRVMARFDEDGARVGYVVATCLAGPL